MLERSAGLRCSVEYSKNCKVLAWQVMLRRKDGASLAATPHIYLTGPTTSTVTKPAKYKYS